MKTVDENHLDQIEQTECLLTQKQVASQLQISERHLTNLSTRGEFPPPIKLGRCVRYKAQDVRGWISGDWRKKKPRPDGQDLAG